MIYYSIDYLINSAGASPTQEAFVYFRQLLNDETACASYLLGCKTHSRFAVVDPHAELVDEYIALAEGQGNRSHGLPSRGRGGRVRASPAG
jgi:hypothetical protein